MNSPSPANISSRTWLGFSFLALLFLAVWFRFGYPQFSAMDLSVGKRQALENAGEFLRGRGVDPGKYRKSVVFDSDHWADTYLQKTMGLEKEEAFVRAHGCELFSWKVRFFRQFEKEEYVIEISPKNGAIVSFEHMIPDTEARESPAKEAALASATAFLTERGFDFSLYDFNDEKWKRFDNRNDYTFTWKKKDLYVPWKGGKGGAKLLSSVTVSGNEALEFYVNRLDIPEDFFRDIQRQMLLGAYISSFSQLLFAVLVIFSLVVFIARRQDLVSRFIRGRVLAVAAVLVAINIFSLVNDIQDVLMDYSTSASLSSYLGIYFLHSLMGAVFLGVIFAIPVLAGELLQPQTFPDTRGRTLTHYWLSSFSTRNVSSGVLLGYLLFLILLGLQSVIFFFGQRYLGVWKQWIKLTEFSSAYVPIFSAFAIGVTASLSEEGVFRLFGINWGKKIFRNTFLAVAFSSIVWGFGHTQYAIFPVWFRGIEVSIMGFVYGFVFLRYGIIPLIVAHYLFDVFWGVSPYLLSKSPAYLFSGSILVMIAPLAFAVYGFLRNRPEIERSLEPFLDPVQRFNCSVLAVFIKGKRSEGSSDEAIRTELIDHKWDPAIVDSAMKEPGNGGAR